MNRLLAFAALVSTFALSPLSAHADAFQFSYVGDGISASGTLDAVNQNNGQFLVDSIAGTRNGIAIASLDTLNQFGSNDNLLSLNSTTPFTFSGISFQTVGGTQFNIYNSGSFTRETTSGLDDGANITFSLSPASAPTPEPSSLVLLGSGFLSAAATLRRKLVRA